MQLQLMEIVQAGSITRAQYRRAMDFARLPPDYPFWLDVETTSGWTVLTKAAAGGDMLLCDELLRKLVIVRQRARLCVRADAHTGCAHAGGL